MTKFLFAIAFIITISQANEFYSSGDNQGAMIFISCSIIFLARALFGK